MPTPTREERIRALTELDAATLEDVVNTAYQQRLGPSLMAAQARPDFHARPAEFARWLALRHRSSDAAINRVVSLPANAPENEIRLLEINRLLNSSEPELIEPLDFSPDDLGFKVFVADVATDQWEAIKADPEATLPAGWKRVDNVIFSRD